MRKDTLEIKKPNLLVVEGDEESYFFQAFIRRIGVSNIQIMPIGGKTKLRKNLKALIRTPKFSEVISLGIERDADDNPRAAFQSVCDALRYVNLPVPRKPLDPTGNQPRVTVLIIPSVNSCGMLEDICFQALAEDPAMSCIEQYFQCLRQNGLSLPNNMAKAKIHAFLASRPEPGKRLGEAAEAGYFPWDAEAFNPLRDFIQFISRE
jgi:hypothetical protein